MIQTRQIEEQMTHWNMINKATKFKLSLVNMSQCVIRSLVCRVCTTSSLNCIGPIEVHRLSPLFCIKKRIPGNDFLTCSLEMAGTRRLADSCQSCVKSSVTRLLKKEREGRRERAREKSILKNKNYFYGFNESLDGLEFKMLDYVKKRPPMNASQGRPSAVRLQLQRTPIVSSLHPLPGMYNKNSLSEKKSL